MFRKFTTYQALSKTATEQSEFHCHPSTDVDIKFSEVKPFSEGHTAIEA